MWNIELFGTDVYHLVAAFVVYSIAGWCLESIYMSFCNRKLTNRGFAKSPFCPIYGFGGTIGYLILQSLKGRYIELYIVGALLATAFEYVVGVMMIKFLGALWWDYNEKPFNYKGIICLESTIAWGFYALGIVGFVHGWIMHLVDGFDIVWGKRVLVVILCIVFVDYVIQFGKVFNVDFGKYPRRVKEQYQNFKARWY